jgi:hypothetical protein
MKNKKIIIIGSGISANILNLLSKKYTKIIGVVNKYNFKNIDLSRRKKMECNKFFSQKSYSYGSVKFNLRNTYLHDRLISGGNSNIWGGNINIKNIPKNVLNFFFRKKIIIKNLSFIKTGTISNDKNIKQLQNTNGNILNTNDLFLKINDGYVLNFFIKRRLIHINTINSKNFIKKIITKKIFLCLGSVQTIDLLYRSNLLKENDTIEFSEFSHTFKLKTIFSRINKKSTVVRYQFSRAIGHLLGIQSFHKFLKILNFIPICVDQEFSFKKRNCKIILKKGILQEIKENNYNNFGKSIHYCNMKINGVTLNKYLKKINKNIFGIGMAFVNQKKPGPIINDIIIDILNKLKINGILSIKKNENSNYRF